MKHDFQFISKHSTEVKEAYQNIQKIVNQVHKDLSKYYTFQAKVVGSYSRNMITKDLKGNTGFDFDFNIYPNDDENSFSAKEMKLLFKRSLDKFARDYGYDYAEDSTRVLTIKVKDNQPGRKQHLIDTLNLNKEKQQYFYFNECEYWIYIIDYKPTDLDFPHAQAYVRMVSHKRADQADYNPEDQYFVSSANNTQLIMEAIDNRWQVEQFHNYKDDFLKEDKCTFTDKNAIQVMAIFNNIAYALYRIASAIFNDSCMAETRIRFKDCPEEMLALLVPLLEKQNLTMLLKQTLRGRKKST